MQVVENNSFIVRFTDLLVRQEQQLLSGNFPIAPDGSGFSSVAEILASEKWQKRHRSNNQENENEKNK